MAKHFYLNGFQVHQQYHAVGLEIDGTMVESFFYGLENECVRVLNLIKEIELKNEFDWFVRV